jgi:hypothetical protein
MRSWGEGQVLRRGIISGFLAMHLAALVAWNAPECALKQAVAPWAGRYILPTGLWQYWGFLGSDPTKETFTLEAVAVDARGMLHVYQFPRYADAGMMRGLARARHARFAASLAPDESDSLRVLGAKHALRELKLPGTAFPVAVQLRYQLLPPPAYNGPPRDPLLAPVPFTLQTYRFPTAEDVRS